MKGAWNGRKGRKEEVARGGRESRVEVARAPLAASGCSGGASGTKVGGWAMGRGGGGETKKEPGRGCLAFSVLDWLGEMLGGSSHCTTN